LLFNRKNDLILLNCCEGGSSDLWPKK